jgi:tetratricopeptide (TPR) repeat protein
MMTLTRRSISSNGHCVRILGITMHGSFRFIRLLAIIEFWLPSTIGRYGLGTCYLRLSKIRLAEYHYRKAVEIHPNNAVLLGCVGMVRYLVLFKRESLSASVFVIFTKTIERRGDREGALTLFDEAVRLAPENALVRYRRAKILIAMKKYDVRMMWSLIDGDATDLIFSPSRHIVYSLRFRTLNRCERRRQRSQM